MTDPYRGMASFDALDLAESINRNLAGEATVRCFENEYGLAAVEVKYPGLAPMLFYSFQEWYNYRRAKDDRQDERRQMDNSDVGMSESDALDLIRLIQRSLTNDVVIRNIKVPEHFLVEVELPNSNPIRFHSAKSWSRWLTSMLRQSLSGHDE